MTTLGSPRAWPLVHDHELPRHTAVLVRERTAADMYGVSGRNAHAPPLYFRYLQLAYMCGQFG
jgi:hypothetical protein